MGGIEEILKQIEIEANNEISEIIAGAEADCANIKKDSDENIKEVIDTKNKQSKAAADLALEKLKSGAEVKRKQDILRLKQKLIAETIEKAHKKMAKLPDEEYFDMLIKIAKKNAHEEDGIIRMNAKYLAKVPADFEKKLAKEGLKLTVAKEPYDIEDGMILDYGDIEENCTFAALISTKKELLQDKINNYIFG